MIGRVAEPNRSRGRPWSMRLCDRSSMRLMALAAVGTLLLTGCGSGSNNGASGGPSSTGSTATTTTGGGGQASVPLTPGDLAGSWKPVALLGRAVQDRIGGHRRLVVSVIAYPQPRWRGYDGCGWTGGPFHIGGSGSFSARATYFPKIFCALLQREWIENVTAITRARRIAVRDGQLNVYGPGGQRIGLYVRVT